jgi:hypothetical protein
MCILNLNGVQSEYTCSFTHFIHKRLLLLLRADINIKICTTFQLFLCVDIIVVSSLSLSVFLVVCYCCSLDLHSLALAIYRYRLMTVELYQIEIISKRRR